MTKLRLRRALAAFLFAGLFPTLACAADIWAITTPRGTCHVTFGDEPVAAGIRTIIQHDNACPKALKNLSGYSMNNGDGSIIFYTTFAGLEMVGRADKERPGHYVGMIGDQDVTVDYGRRRAEAPKPQKPQKPVPAEAACLRYPDGRCAQRNDIGSPNLARGINTIQALTRLNIRAMPGTEGAIIGRLEKDQCVKVIGCVEQGRKVIWCEVDMPTFHGWTLKQDGENVYSRNACG